MYLHQAIQVSNFRQYSWYNVGWFPLLFKTRPVENSRSQAGTMNYFSRYSNNQKKCISMPFQYRMLELLGNPMGLRSLLL
jgi:hypothetical protein